MNIVKQPQLVCQSTFWTTITFSRYRHSNYFRLVWVVFLKIVLRCRAFCCWWVYFKGFFLYLMWLYRVLESITPFYVFLVQITNYARNKPRVPLMFSVNNDPSFSISTAFHPLRLFFKCPFVRSPVKSQLFRIFRVIKGRAYWIIKWNIIGKPKHALIRIVNVLHAIYRNRKTRRSVFRAACGQRDARSDSDEPK